MKRFVMAAAFALFGTGAAFAVAPETMTKAVETCCDVLADCCKEKEPCCP